MSLAALQRDFRSWLTVEANDAAGRLGEHAAPGLAVYLNNYRGQLMTCLAQSFGAVRAWLGDTAFDGAAATHIDRRPPHSWTLDAYAIEFPDTLDTLYPQDPEVAELASLERDLGLAFVARDAAQLTLPDIAHIDWSSAILELAPAFSLLPVTTNAGAIWAAIEGGQTPPAAAILDVPAVIAIWRKGYSPTFRTLDAVEARAMFMLTDGRTFGEICAALVHEVGEVDGPPVVGNLLARWITEGMIGSVPGGLARQRLQPAGSG
jgi:Putative DNA-binding domain